jgi:hypothetical protein
MSNQKAKKLIDEYEFHTRLIHRFVDGISHEESLLQPPFEANCLNWILGHIVNNRSHTLEVLGIPHIWQTEVRALYDIGTAPIKPGSESIYFDLLHQYLDQSQTLINSTLENIRSKFLDEPFTNYRGEKTRYDHAMSFHWHEAFHLGQLDILNAMVQSKRK